MTQCEQENLDLSWASKPAEECSKMLVLQSKSKDDLPSTLCCPNTALKVRLAPPGGKGACPG